jgi:hypothetical protein
LLFKRVHVFLFLDVTGDVSEVASFFSVGFACAEHVVAELILRMGVFLFWAGLVALSNADFSIFVLLKESTVIVSLRLLVARVN